MLIRCWSGFARASGWQFTPFWLNVVVAICDGDIFDYVNLMHNVNAVTWNQHSQRCHRLTFSTPNPAVRQQIGNLVWLISLSPKVGLCPRRLTGKRLLLKSGVTTVFFSVIGVFGVMDCCAVSFASTVNQAPK